MKKIILIITIILYIFLWINKSIAYNSEDIINISVTNITSWQNVYTVPDWKDLIIKKIYLDDFHVTHYLDIRDNWWNTLLRLKWNEVLLHDNLFVKISDNLELSSNDNNDTYNIFWFLVSEDESVENYIEWNSNAFNKNIFTKKDIDFIYFREFIFFIFVMIFKFFEFIIWRKMIWKFF